MAYSKNPNKANDNNYIYIKGNATTNGSIRYSISAEEDAQIEKLVSGAWQGTELLISPGTLKLGDALAISAAGHHLMAEHSNKTHRHLYAHRSINDIDTETDPEVTILRLHNKQTRSVSHSDESTVHTNTSIAYGLTSSAHIFLEKVYMKTGPTAATQPVRVSVYSGVDNTGERKWNWNYPANIFPANSEIEIPVTGMLEYDAGEQIYAEFTSAAAFSLKGSVAGQPWRAADFFEGIEENILATTEFISGNPYTKGEWYVDGPTKKIYVCNTTGIQTGTFASNIALWDLLSHEGNDFWTRTGTTLSTKTAGDSVQIDGNLYSKSIYDVSSQSLVVAMNLNSESIDGNTVLDSSGANNHGTNDGATHDPTGGFNGGGAYEFDGTDDSINLGDIDGIEGGNELTIAAWVKFDGGSTATAPSNSI